MNILKESIASQLFIAITILLSGLIINVVQILLHICIKPFNKKLFHQCMYFVCWTWLAQIVYLLDYWSKSELILHCKPEDFKYIGHEHSFVIMNHTYEIDWLVCWLLLEKRGSLGSGRAFVKNQAKFIPIAGWFFWLSGHVFLQRSFDKDQKVFEERLSEFMTYPFGTMTFFTAEGTRFTKEKHEASLKFAEEKSIEPFKHHLIPRPKGFMACIPVLKEHKCPAVYNLQIAFDKEAPTRPSLGNVLMGRKLVAHVYIERIPMEKIEPTFKCLHDIYKEKDALQDSFHKFGNFYEGRGLKNVEGMRMKPEPRVLINAIVWQLIVMAMLLYYVAMLVMAGKIFSLASIIIGVIAIICYVRQNILKHTNIKKASQYGKSR